MLKQQTGASLLELMVAASIGVILLLAIQQSWSWQQVKQQQSSIQSRALLTAQSLIQQLAGDLKATDATAVSMTTECFLLPQLDGRQLAYRVSNQQLQRHTLAPHCPRRGWQSLSHFSRLAIDDLSIELLTTQGPPLLTITLVSHSPTTKERYAFHRELSLPEAAAQ